MSSKEKNFLISSYRKILQAVHPDALFKKYLHFYDRTLYFNNTPINTEAKGRLILAGSGKASVSMAEAILPFLPRMPDEGLLIAPSGAPQGTFRVYCGDHPVPGEMSFRAAKYMLDLLDGLNEDDILLYMLSGGSSSLFELPEAGMSPYDIRNAVSSFLARGLRIQEINDLRSCLSQVKGGKLAKRCRADTHVFVLSDVMGNDLRSIGSGPFYWPGESVHSVSDLINAYHLEEDLPAHVLNMIRANRPPEDMPQVPHYLTGSNMDLISAAADICMNAGIRPLSFPESLFGEARDAGYMIADMMKLYSGPTPACMIFGGEPTVTLSGDTGYGGRSQELALAVLEQLRDMKDYTLLSAGSDGMDGTGGAAGACVDASTFHQAEIRGLSIGEYMERHDSYHFHKKCNSLITTGYSGTNVTDIVMALMKS